MLLLLCAALCAVQSLFALTIEDGKFYTIANRNDVNLFVKDTGADIIQMGALDDACYWQFIATANEGCFYVKNKKTGRYAQQCSTSTEVNVLMGDNPVEYRVKECTVEGTDMFGLTSTNENNTEFTSGCVGWNWKNDNTVQTFAAAAGTNHRSFWKLIMVTPPMAVSTSKVYVMSNRNDNNLYVRDNGGSELVMGNLDNASLWQFQDAGNGQFYVRNVNTGRYVQACATETEVAVQMGTAPVPYVVVNCSDKEGQDCFGLTSADQGNTAFTNGCVGWNWRNDNVVQTFAAVAGTNHRSFWKFTELEPQSITEAGYATYCATQDVMVLGAQAYKAAVTGNYVSLSKVEDVPAKSAVVLKGELYAVVPATAHADMSDNQLKVSDGTVTGDNIFILAENHDAVGFYRMNPETFVPAQKAYLNLGSNPVREFLSFGESETGIQSPAPSHGGVEAALYDLSGRRLSDGKTSMSDGLKKGLYIINGKKILY